MGWAGALAPMLLASWRTCCPCSRLRCRCAVAVARPSLRPLPPSWSPCHHVAVAPLRSRRHRAFAGDCRAYAPCAVPRCLVGLVRCPWLRGLVGRVIEVVVAVVGGGRRAYAPRVVLVSLLGRPWLRTPLGVVVGIVIGTGVGVLVAGGGAVSIFGSSVVDALLTPEPSGRLASVQTHFP